jgi:predicted esterase
MLMDSPENPDYTVDVSYLEITKTARYFTLGNPGSNITSVWFCCHGYGQIASSFIKNFSCIDDGKTLVVAPEGLHRFYWNGFDGKVVASWMTKEDRLNVRFLDTVYSQVLSLLKNKSIVINVLGFSQGVATVTRWLSANKSNADNLILWAGIFPPDLNINDTKDVFENLNTHLVYGTNDEYLSFMNVEEYKKLLENVCPKHKVITFDGKHEINNEVLQQLNAVLAKK